MVHCKGLDCIYWNLEFEKEPIDDKGDIIYNIELGYKLKTSTNGAFVPFATVEQKGTFERKKNGEKSDNYLIQEKGNCALSEFWKSSTTNKCTICKF